MMLHKYCHVTWTRGWRRVVPFTGYTTTLPDRVFCSLRLVSSNTAARDQEPLSEPEWMAASLFEDVPPLGAGGSGGNARSTPSTVAAESLAHDDASPERQARRQRHHAARRLSDVVAKELRAEVTRDCHDGVSAIPPLAPPGWNVQHRPGTRLFTLSKCLSGRARRRRHVDREEGASRAVDVEAADGPRFRSIHEEQQARQGHRRAPLSHHSRATAATATGAATATSPPPPLADVQRADTMLTVLVPFRVQDMSLTDPNVSICEYAPFDLLVRKERPRESGRLAALHAVEGQERLWADGQCLYVSLASVNSELRLRGVQFLSQRTAQTLEHYAFYGGGDPLFRDLLARQRAVVQRRHTHLRTSSTTSSERTASDSGSGGGGVSTFTEPSTRRELAQAGAAAPRAAEDGDVVMGTVTHYNAESLLLREPSYAGRVARRMCYQGPYITELSREFQEALMQYLVSELGINSVLVEYVNQMTFFLEQEEYMGWLARLGHMASALEKRA